MPKNDIKPARELRQLVGVINDIDEDLLTSKAQGLSSGDDTDKAVALVIAVLLGLKAQGVEAQRPYERDPGKIKKKTENDALRRILAMGVESLSPEKFDMLEEALRMMCDSRHLDTEIINAVCGMPD